jgi:hypothetical protein
VQVLWANESTGIDGDLWTDVHDPRVVGAQTPTHAGKPPGAQGAGVTRTLGARLAARCAVRPGCAARAALAASGREGELELPVARQPSRPELLRSLPRESAAQ